MKRCNFNVWAFVILTCAGGLASANNFKYPQRIVCQPERAVSVSVGEGIHDDPDFLKMVKEHAFEYSGDRQYKLGNGMGFRTGLTHQNTVLNLYSGSNTYSIDLVNRRYVLSGATAWAGTAGGSANDTFLEGSCKIAM